MIRCHGYIPAVSISKQTRMSLIETFCHIHVTLLMLALICIFRWRLFWHVSLHLEVYKRAIQPIGHRVTLKWQRWLSKLTFLDLLAGRQLESDKWACFLTPVARSIIGVLWWLHLPLAGATCPIGLRDGQGESTIWETLPVRGFHTGPVLFYSFS